MAASDVQYFHDMIIQLDIKVNNIVDVVTKIHKHQVDARSTNTKCDERNQTDNKDGKNNDKHKKDNDKKRERDATPDSSISSSPSFVDLSPIHPQKALKIAKGGELNKGGEIKMSSSSASHQDEKGSKGETKGNKGDGSGGEDDDLKGGKKGGKSEEPDEEQKSSGEGGCVLKDNPKASKQVRDLARWLLGDVGEVEEMMQGGDSQTNDAQ